MTPKKVIIASTSLILTGIVLGVLVRKDHTVTELVGVPVRVATPVAVAVPARVVVAPVPSAGAQLPANSVAVSTPGAVPSADPVVPPAPPTHVARQGDTLSNVATGLLGSDTKANRAAVVVASPSLQANPDLVVTGRQYDLSFKGNAPTVPTAPTAAEPITPAEPTATPDPTTVMKYTAAPGDTVTHLASALMGGDTKSNRDAIVEANPSLQANPDHLEAGKAYRIVAPEGGLAAASVAAAPVKARPTTQPDADQVVHDDHQRVLRYTAKAGDTLGSLAEVLLGSDSAANRNTILNANDSLKTDPDRVIEGKTYWIPAPVAEVSTGQ